MFKILSVTEIKRFIDEDRSSDKKRLAAVGQKYYEARHDILNYKMYYFNADGKMVEDKYRSNIKISHPFFTLLSDQLSAYVLSFKDNPIQAKVNDETEGLQDHLDMYFDEEFWSEIGELVKGAYNKGFDYIYAFKGKDDRLVFQQADGMGVVEVRAKDTDDNCEHILYWYVDRIDKGKKVITRIQDWTETETYYYVQSGKSGKIVLDDSVEINPRPHVVYTDAKTGKKMGYPLGFIPFWRLDNNKKQISGLAPIKDLIDDYDLHACSLSNNLKDFDTPIHVVAGYPGDNFDELQKNIQTKKIIGVDSEGSIDIKTVDIPYQARKEKLDLDERNIYKFGMGVDTTSLKDTSATTNMAIKTAFYGLDLKAIATTKRLCALLKDIVKVVLAEINETNGTDYQMKNIEFNFERTSLTNESENIQNQKTEAETQQIRINTILNVAVNVGDDQTLKAICDVMDWDFEEIKGQVEQMQAEQEQAAAKAALENAVVEDAEKTEEEPSEQPEEPVEE